MNVEKDVSSSYDLYEAILFLFALIVFILVKQWWVTNTLSTQN